MDKLSEIKRKLRVYQYLVCYMYYMFLIKHRIYLISSFLFFGCLNQIQINELILHTKPPIIFFYGPKTRLKCLNLKKCLLFFNIKENLRNEVLVDNLYMTEKKMERQQEVLLFIKMLIVKVVFLMYFFWDEMSCNIDM